MLGMELPALVESILPWVPSVALAEICRAAFSETVPVTQVLTDLWISPGRFAAALCPRHLESAPLGSLGNCVIRELWNDPFPITWFAS